MALVTRVSRRQGCLGRIEDLHAPGRKALAVEARVQALQALAQVIIDNLPNTVYPADGSGS